MTSTVTNTIGVLISLICGLISLWILGSGVQRIVQCLKHKKGLQRALEREGHLGIFREFGRIEQFLFFLVWLAGKETMFGVVAGAWLVLKGIQQWVRWDSSRWRPERSETQPPGVPDEIWARDRLLERQNQVADFNAAHDCNPNLTVAEYRAQLDRNRFMIFVAGTGLSIAAGGASGAVYFFVAKEIAPWLVSLLKCF